MACSNPTIIIERNVPFLDRLSDVASIKYLPYRDITADAVRDADALIVRTRNKCDAALLEGSRVSFIGTATIGTDHIDLPWCRAHGIEVVNAPGSNAPAVAQYVICSMAQTINRPLKTYTLGIVGVGNVGRIVERWARSIGMQVILCDPPRQRAEGGDQWCTLADIAVHADIITFHTPYTTEGPDATHHLADAAFFNSLKRAPIIINSARGPVVDNAAWIDAIKAGIVGDAVIDCWEGEPSINTELLGLATIATPHIAGYSLAGKQRASLMVMQALCRHFGLPEVQLMGSPIPPVADDITVSAAVESYDPLDDTDTLKANPLAFELLRNSYALRPEISEALEN